MLPDALLHSIPPAGIAPAFFSTLSVLAFWRGHARARALIEHVAQCLDVRCRGAAAEAGQ